MAFVVNQTLLVQGELFADLSHGSSDLCLGAFKVPGGHADALGNLLHLGFTQAAGGNGGGADADAGGNCELFRVAGDGVLVQGDMVGIAASDGCRCRR